MQLDIRPLSMIKTRAGEPVNFLAAPAPAPDFFFQAAPAPDFFPKRLRLLVFFRAGPGLALGPAPAPAPAPDYWQIFFSPQTSKV